MGLGVIVFSATFNNIAVISRHLCFNVFLCSFVYADRDFYIVTFCLSVYGILSCFSFFLNVFLFTFA